MLQLKNLTKSSPGLFAPVLNKFHLDLHPGDFCMVIGSNGSGKSTLFKLITGEYLPDSGNILFNQKDITRAAFHQRAHLIQSVSQDILKSTVSELTLLENLVLSQQRKSAFKGYFLHTKSLTELVASYQLGLENYMHTPLSALSGGQRQMLAILMATLSSAPLLLFDEHCSALDPKRAREAMDLTCQVIKKQNCTALMITHQLSDAVHYGNRLIMLKNGQIALDIEGADKQKLSVPQLMRLFYENIEANPSLSGEDYVRGF